MWTSRHAGGTRSEAMRASVRRSRTQWPCSSRYSKRLRGPVRRIHDAMATRFASLAPTAGLGRFCRMAYETITYSVTDRIATITVNRPDKLNALNARVIAELGDVIDAARADSSVGGVVLTGAG